MRAEWTEDAIIASVTTVTTNFTVSSVTSTRNSQPSHNNSGASLRNPRKLWLLRDRPLSSFVAQPPECRVRLASCEPETEVVLQLTYLSGDQGCPSNDPKAATLDLSANLKAADGKADAVIAGWADGQPARLCHP